jgi:hypothetical protein
VELGRLELPAFSLRTRRASRCAIAPRSGACGNRTRDLRSARPTLSQAELRPHGCPSSAPAEWRRGRGQLSLADLVRAHILPSRVVRVDLGVARCAVINCQARSPRRVVLRRSGAGRTLFPPAFPDRPPSVGSLLCSYRRTNENRPLGVTRRAAPGCSGPSCPLPSCRRFRPPIAQGSHGQREGRQACLPSVSLVFGCPESHVACLPWGWFYCSGGTLRAIFIISRPPRPDAQAPCPALTLAAAWPPSVDFTQSTIS